MYLFNNYTMIMDTFKKAKKNQLWYWTSMNEIINEFKTTCNYIQGLWTIYYKNKENYKNLKKQDIQDIFT